LLDDGTVSFVDGSGIGDAPEDGASVDGFSPDAAEDSTDGGSGDGEAVDGLGDESD
jgi:hypothetical protein